jgi:leucyl aminopeptidase
MTLQLQVVRGDIAQITSDVAIVSLFEGVEQPGGATGTVDRALGGLIRELIRDGEVTGKKGNNVLIHTPTGRYGDFAPKRVLVMGLGKSSEFDVNGVREIAAAAVDRLGGIVETATTIIHGAGIGGLSTGDAAQALAEGSIIGAYSFDKYKTSSKKSASRLKRLDIVEFLDPKIPEVRSGVGSGISAGEAQNFARSLVNEPPNVLSPEAMADAAMNLADDSGLEVRVLEMDECLDLGMNAFAGVAQGSQRPAYFVHLTYEGDPSDAANNAWLVGKSITFDSGGLSLKSPLGMVTMKGDMGGGAAVLGAMQIIGARKPRINVHAVLPITENMPGGSAQRPGDVVQAMNGKYIEIDNTDAEGRLTLADALGYARANGAARIIDVATLTGAARVALGTGNAAVFGNDDALMASALDAADAAGDGMWRLPLDAASKRQNRSNIADVKNSGGAPAGSITAAHFISEFAEDTPWVHIDIAAVSMVTGKRGMFWTPGATGSPTRTLANLIAALAK